MRKKFIIKSKLILAVVIQVFFLLAYCLCAKASAADLLNQSFNGANLLYKESKYNEAIAEYNNILARGFESGNIYYNLGNCYVKTGELGRAALNYERAGFFLPADSDLRSNYDYVISLLHLTDRQVQGKWYLVVLDRMFRNMGIDQLTVFLAVLYLLIVLFFILRIFVGTAVNAYRPVTVILLLLLILGGISLERKINLFNKGAIVISKEAEVKFGPFESATAYFNLSEGSRIEVIEKGPDWYKIRRADGKTGWINKASLSLIQTVSR